MTGGQNGRSNGGSSKGAAAFYLDDSEDVTRIKEIYDLGDFPYRVWLNEETPQDPDWTLAYAGLEEMMAAEKPSWNQKGAPIPWEMPEDLRARTLPMLSRMPGVDGLLQKLRHQGAATVSTVVEEKPLPELQDELPEEGSVLPPLGSRRGRASTTTQNDDEVSAKNKLRSLALKGIKNA